MNDILLINPPLTLSERYGRNVGNVGGNVPPLGILYIAAYLRKFDYKVSIIDSVIEQYSIENIINLIKKNIPKVIGITSMTNNFKRGIALAEKIKSLFPQILILIGGSHASILPIDIIKNNWAFDILVYGEGELTIKEIMDFFSNKNFDVDAFLGDITLLNNIAGIVFRNKNEIIKTQKRELIQNLDLLPFPAWDLIPTEKYIPLPNQYYNLPVFYLVVIRGCPFNCTFCSNSIFGRKIRAMSPNKVVELIEYAINKFGAKEISFWDDLLTFNKRWINDLCDLILEKKLNITWTCLCRVDTVDFDIIKKMKKAGCWNIFFGVESGDPQLLKNIKKNINLEQIRNAFKFCKANDVEIRAAFMLGLPGETPELAQKTIDFAIELNPDYAQFTITTPYPGTELYEKYHEYGKLNLDLSYYNSWNAVFIPYGYSDAKQIESFQKKAMRKFYFRFKYILGRLSKIRSKKDLMRYINGIRFLLGFLMKKN